jgi:hypothetical protein
MFYLRINLSFQLFARFKRPKTEELFPFSFATAKFFWVFILDCEEFIRRFPASLFLDRADAWTWDAAAGALGSCATEWADDPPKEKGVFDPDAAHGWARVLGARAVWFACAGADSSYYSRTAAVPAAAVTLAAAVWAGVRIGSLAREGRRARVRIGFGTRLNRLGVWRLTAPPGWASPPPGPAPLLVGGTITARLPPPRLLRQDVAGRWVLGLLGLGPRGARGIRLVALPLPLQLEYDWFVDVIDCENKERKISIYTAW